MDEGAEINLRVSSVGRDAGVRKEWRSDRSRGLRNKENGSMKVECEVELKDKEKREMIVNSYCGLKSQGKNVIG